MISLGATPNTEPNNPPLTNESSVLSSVGVNTLSSSNGINSILSPLPTTELSSGITVNVLVEPSPLNTSEVCLSPLMYTV